MFRFTESKLHGSVSFRSSFVTLHDMKYAQVYFSSSLVTSKLPDFFLFFYYYYFLCEYFSTQRESFIVVSSHPWRIFLFVRTQEWFLSERKWEISNSKIVNYWKNIHTLSRFFFLLNFQLRFYFGFLARREVTVSKRHLVIIRWLNICIQLWWCERIIFFVRSSGRLMLRARYVYIHVYLMAKVHCTAGMMHYVKFVYLFYSMYISR